MSGRRPATLGVFMTAHRFIVSEYLAKHSVTTLSQPPYSTDLVPSGFFLFPMIKKELKGHHFGTLEGAKEVRTRCFKKVPFDAFQGVFNAWEKRWSLCSDAEGCYFKNFSCLYLCLKYIFFPGVQLTFGNTM